MIIPYERLSADVLQALIEEYITRDGTDYGEIEVSLSDKVEQVRSQLRDKDIVIVFDPTLESASLQPRLLAEANERLLKEGGSDS